MKDSLTYNDHQSESLSKQTWRKFKKNRLGMFGLILIVIATVISICGYLITPDSTPFANDQKPELHIKKPGFKVGMLMIKKNEATHQVSFFSKMLFGEVSDYSSIPYYSIKFVTSNQSPSDQRSGRAVEQARNRKRWPQRRSPGALTGAWPLRLR